MIHGSKQRERTIHQFIELLQQPKIVRTILRDAGDFRNPLCLQEKYMQIILYDFFAQLMLILYS